MKGKKEIINNHYLSMSYKVLINNEIIHSFLFLIEQSFIFLQILEIYYNDFNIFNNDNTIYICPFTYLLIKLNKLPLALKNILYTIIIIIIMINSFIFNFYRIRINLFSKIMINISEILFYRILTLFFFYYLFILEDIYFIINIIISIHFIMNIYLNFYKNHLFIYFPCLISYPYDTFSMIIDIYLLFIKVFISISSTSSNKNISKLFYILSICIFLVLLLYLTYLLLYKSYYIMNNSFLNKIRYSILLSECIVLILIFIIDKKELNNIYYIICFCNIVPLCIFSITSFYNPYRFVKFGNDDNIENLFYYFFILDRNKNKYLLIEEKIDEHLLKCNRCNLCQKYNKINMKYFNEEIDLYNIISNSHNPVYNLMNKIIRGIKKNGKKSFINNSYFLINIIYIYCMAINHKNYNIALNSELLFEIINSGNIPFLEEYKISLKHIIYTNNFFINANKVIEIIYNMIEEKNLNKQIEIFFELGDELENLKYKEIKSNFNINSNNNGNNLEGIPNCNNLLTICCLFYEELFNESFSNSGVPIRDSPNILEDLINNNYKNSRQITLKINILNFEVKIMRAGGNMNKYENQNFFEFFSPIFKKKQINEMKKLLFHSNSNYFNKKIKINKNKSNLENETQYINYTFIIEEKENDVIFSKLLKMKLNLILLTNINNIIYLNGIYTIDNNIIITEQIKGDEILLSFGNIGQNNYIPKKYENKNIFISSKNNEKYLGNKKLVKLYNYLGCKKYSVYQILLSNKKNTNEKHIKNRKQLVDNFEDEQYDLLEEDKKLNIIKDIASQASSTNSSSSKVNLISYTRGNKKSHKKQNIIKEYNIFKFILLSIIIFILIVIVIECIYLKIFMNFLNNLDDFFLSYEEFCSNFYRLFFSVLSLGCIANSTESFTCRHYMGELTTIIVNDYFKSVIDNNDIDEGTIKSHFIDLIKLIFYQNQIISEDLSSSLYKLINVLSKYHQNDIISHYFDSNISHFKISQNYQYNKINLLYTKENISFSQFNLLITSRFSILTRNIIDSKQPIYILNKTGEETFNNILIKERLSTYQENIYLLILDHREYSGKLDSTLSDIINIIFTNKKLIRKIIFFILNFNLIIFIILIIFLIFYLFVYYIIILNNINKIQNDLKEKIGDDTIKELIINKINNLKLLLKFYETDINKTINKLKKFYNNYTDNYRTKIKEESKLLKRDGKIDNKKNETKKLKINKIFKNFKNLKVMEFSGRKKLYIYSLICIIFIYLSIFVLILVMWLIYFKKHDKVFAWNIISEEINIATNQMMNNYLMMIYNNYTFEEISIKFNSEDFTGFIFNKLTPIYELDKYTNYLLDVLKDTEMTIFYDCSDFYDNLDNDLFKRIKNKVEQDEKKLMYSMWFFCEWSNAMVFHNFKTVYIQLFTLVKTSMENFINYNYTDIIESIDKNGVVKNEIMYSIIYIYMTDIMYQNIKTSIKLMGYKMENNINITIASSLAILLFLIISIYYVYIRNMNNDCKKFIHVSKIFKICNTDI